MQPNFFDFNAVDREAFMTIFESIGINSSKTEELLALASNNAYDCIQNLLNTAGSIEDIIEQNLVTTMTMLIIDSYVKRAIDGVIQSFYETVMFVAQQKGISQLEMVKIFTDLNEGLGGFGA